MTGPAPKHPSTRSRARDGARTGFRALSGRKGALPAWPLQPDITLTAMLETLRDKVAGMQVELENEEDGRAKGRLRRSIDKAEIAASALALQIEQAGDMERDLWADLWGMPQAEMWEESKAHREVAQYVRWKIRGEQGNLDAAKEARMLSDRLGLNPLALMRLRAEAERADEAQARGNRRRAAQPAPKKPGDDPRSHLHSVG